MNYDRPKLKKLLQDNQAQLWSLSPLDIFYINEQIDKLKAGQDPVLTANNLIAKFPQGLAKDHVKGLLAKTKLAEVPLPGGEQGVKIEPDVSGGSDFSPLILVGLVAGAALLLAKKKK